MENFEFEKQVLKLQTLYYISRCETLQYIRMAYGCAKKLFQLEMIKKSERLKSAAEKDLEVLEIFVPDGNIRNELCNILAANGISLDPENSLLEFGLDILAIGIFTSKFRKKRKGNAKK